MNVRYYFCSLASFAFSQDLHLGNVSFCKTETQVSKDMFGVFEMLYNPRSWLQVAANSSTILNLRPHPSRRNEGKVNDAESIKTLKPYSTEFEGTDAHW
jgi:hypothetical protein